MLLDAKDFEEEIISEFKLVILAGLRCLLWHENKERKKKKKEKRGGDAPFVAILILGKVALCRLIDATLTQ